MFIRRKSSKIAKKTITQQAEKTTEKGESQRKSFDCQIRLRGRKDSEFAIKAILQGRKSYDRWQKLVVYLPKNRSQLTSYN
jgi:beta-galactosidase beta subunit